MATDSAERVTEISRRSVARSRKTAHASRRTVLIALLANAAVMVAKLIAGVMGGSAAVLAEAAHSLADTVNQGFLLVSINLASREPTPEHPFGYGRSRYLWTFMAALAMFLAGAVFAIGFGVYRLLSGGESGGFITALTALVIALLAEGSSWIRAVRQTRREAAELQMTVIQYTRESRDPNVKMVLFEDTAALIGIGLALVGIVADQLTGSQVFDPAASIAIGLLLVVVAAWMARDTSALLVGASARPAERAALEQAFQEFPEISRVLELMTLVLGPNALLVGARLDFADGLRDDEVERVSDRIDERLREVVPDVTEVFLDATTAGNQRQALAEAGTVEGLGSRRR